MREHAPLSTHTPLATCASTVRKIPECPLAPAVRSVPAAPAPGPRCPFSHGITGGTRPENLPARGAAVGIDASSLPSSEPLRMGTILCTPRAVARLAGATPWQGLAHHAWAWRCGLRGVAGFGGGIRRGSPAPAVGAGELAAQEAEGAVAQPGNGLGIDTAPPSSPPPLPESAPVKTAASGEERGAWHPVPLGPARTCQAGPARAVRAPGHGAALLLRDGRPRPARGVGALCSRPFSLHFGVGWGPGGPNSCTHLGTLLPEPRRERPPSHSSASCPAFPRCFGAGPPGVWGPSTFTCVHPPAPSGTCEAGERESSPLVGE